jgi:hypothetical protein
MALECNSDRAGWPIAMLGHNQISFTSPSNPAFGHQRRESVLLNKAQASFPIDSALMNAKQSRASIIG